jgi:broad specificity phosphatase PhoE
MRIVTLASLLISLAVSARAADTGSAPTPDTTVTTIILVRHAERHVTFAGTDPPISKQGARRAEALAHALRDAGIGAIYSTHWRRNRETAAPLARLLGDSVQVVGQGDAAVFARRVVAENRNGAALVVGHSDTIPQILAALTGQPVTPFPAGEFDGMYVVTRFGDGRTRLTKLRYGEPSAAPK